MAKIISIDEHFQHFLNDLKDSFWGDLEGKKQFANYFVGDAFLDYLDADLACRAAAILLLKDNARYYDAHDTYAYLVQLRAGIERQYDPKSHMKVKRNQTFYAQAGLPLLRR